MQRLHFKKFLDAVMRSFAPQPDSFTPPNGAAA
jgi:hypothetical protein